MLLKKRQRNHSGIEASMTFTESWKMNVGFVKKVFESHAVDKPTDFIAHAFGQYLSKIKKTNKSSA